MQKTAERPQLAVIGGTGVYEYESLTDIEKVDIRTPYGPTSDTILIGTLEGMRVAFLARHGKGHCLLPGEVPYQANIWALKALGVERVVAVSACGSMKEEYEPGHVVIPDQLFDRTRGRAGTFFGAGLVAHVSFAHPFCPTLRVKLGDAVRAAGGTVHMGGTYIAIEGPRFSSLGESLVFRQWGVDIIGMTVVPEAQLAREAEMCYGVMAHVTDYDCWHEAEEAVSVELVIKTLQGNARLAKKAIALVARGLDNAEATQECECSTALRNAILTPAELIPSETKRRLEPIIGKYV